MGLRAESIAEIGYRISDGGFAVAELSATARAEMCPMWMDAEPVFVEMFEPTQRTLNGLNLESEDGRYHVIYGVELGNEEVPFSFVGGRGNESNGSEGGVDDLGVVVAMASVYMNTLLGRPVGSVVDGRNGTPDRYTAVIQGRVEG